MSSHWGPCCDCVITGSRESDASRREQLTDKDATIASQAAEIERLRGRIAELEMTPRSCCRDSKAAVVVLGNKER